MNTYLIRGLCCLIGYIFGCIHFAFIFGHSAKHIDIRDYGSGNSGTTNALRVLGTNWGLWTLLGDNMKAILAVVVVGMLYGFDQKVYMIWAGLGVVLGHNYPFYMQFRGGKGVAALMGIFLATDIRMWLIAGAPAVLLIILTRYVSLGSLTYMALLIVTSIIFYHAAPGGLEFILITSFLAIMTIIRHRANIKRLVTGTERKIGEKVNPNSEPEPTQTPDKTPEA